MIITPSKVKWIVNHRLKSSIRYKRRFIFLEVELPKALEHITDDQKNTIIKYIDLKKKRGLIPRELKNEFSSLFPPRQEINRMNVSHEDRSILIKIVNELNTTYFKNECSIDDIYWSKVASRRTLGRYYEHNKSICISSYLNNGTVPVYVLEYIVYHEMCHQVCPPFLRGGRRAIHHKEFKKREKEYMHYLDATKWIKFYIK